MWTARRPAHTTVREAADVLSCQIGDEALHKTGRLNWFSIQERSPLYEIMSNASPSRRVRREGLDILAVESVAQGAQSRDGDRACNVVMAAGLCQKPRIPAFSADLPADIRLVHSDADRNPQELLTWGFPSQGVKISCTSVELQYLFRYPKV
jgi:hypothetical protein